jgi:hypothetical protein
MLFFFGGFHETVGGSAGGKQVPSSSDELQYAYTAFFAFLSGSDMPPASL